LGTKEIGWVAAIIFRPFRAPAKQKTEEGDGDDWQTWILPVRGRFSLFALSSFIFSDLGRGPGKMTVLPFRSLTAWRAGQTFIHPSAFIFG